MFDERSQDYFARREAEERDAARTATAKEERAIHLQMAYRYAALQLQHGDRAPAPWTDV